MPPRGNFHVRLPADLDSDLAAYADHAGLSRNHVTVLALRDYLAAARGTGTARERARLRSRFWKAQKELDYDDNNIDALLDLAPLERLRQLVDEMEGEG